MSHKPKNQKLQLKSGNQTDNVSLITALLILRLGTVNFAIFLTHKQNKSKRSRMTPADGGRLGSSQTILGNFTDYRYPRQGKRLKIA